MFIFSQVTTETGKVYKGRGRRPGPLKKKEEDPFIGIFFIYI